MKIKSTFWLAAAFFITHVGTSLNAAEQSYVKKEEPKVQILTGEFDRSYPDGQIKDTFVITGKSNLTIQKVYVDAEGGTDSNFTVRIATDDFPKNVMGTLFVKVNDKIFAPHAWLGKSTEVYNMIELINVDRVSAETLNGGELPVAPKSNLIVEYTPYQKIYPLNGQISMGIVITNTGKTPLTFYWGTTGGGNYPCRDTQLSFTATLDGAPVAANPKPLPDGFISSPFTAKPNSALKRSVDLTEWLQFQKPGKYRVEATYTVEIMNPQKDASPRQWKVSYLNQFTVEVGD